VHEEKQCALRAKRLTVSDAANETARVLPPETSVILRGPFVFSVVKILYSKRRRRTMFRTACSPAHGT